MGGSILFINTLLETRISKSKISALSKLKKLPSTNFQSHSEAVKSVKAKYSLPFRPLVYGGDDITFVCEGRLGLELAALFLQEFEKQPVADGKPLTACTGICVVKTYYPFARAYQISEDLCKNAKKLVKERKKSEPDGFSAIDWHFTASDLIGTISDIREREYQITADQKTWNLAMRPVRLRSHRGNWRIWEGFTKVVQEFKEGKDWKERQKI